MRQNRLIIQLLTIATIICMTSCDMFKKITPDEYIEPKEGDTLTVAQAIRYVQYLGVDSLSPIKVYVKGEITSIAYSQDNFMRASFRISDPKMKNEFFCREVHYLQNTYFMKKDLIKVGDEVIVYGRIMNFKGTQPETQGGGNAYISSLNGKSEPDKTVDEEEVKTITIAQAIEIMDTLSTPYTAAYYKIECEMIEIMSDNDYLLNHGAVIMIIKDSTGKMTAAEIKNFNNEPFTSPDQLPTRGSILAIIGKLHKFSATSYQITNGYIKDVIKQGDGTTTDDKPADPIIEPKEGDTLTVAEANLYVKQLGADILSPIPVFVKGIVTEISQVSVSNGNATFKMSDADANNSFTCYRVRYLENSPFTSNKQIAVGDEVVVYGKVLLYAGAVAETESEAAYIYSKNGQSELPVPQTYDVTIGRAIEIIDSLEAGEVSFDFYEIVCKINEIKTTDNNILFYGNADFIVSDETGSMTAYRTLNTDSTKFTDLSQVPIVGTTVKIRGRLTKYNNMTYEIVNCYIKEVIDIPAVTEHDTIQTTISEALEIINNMAQENTPT